MGRSPRGHGVLVSPAQGLGRSTGSKHPSQTPLRDTSPSCQHFPQHELKPFTLNVICNYWYPSRKLHRRYFLNLWWKERLLLYHSPPNRVDPFHPSQARSASFKFGDQLYFPPSSPCSESDSGRSSPGQLIKQGASLHSFKFPGNKKAPKHFKSLGTKPNRYQAKSYSISGFSHTISVRAWVLLQPLPRTH